MLDKLHLISLLFRWQILHDLVFDGVVTCVSGRSSSRHARVVNHSPVMLVAARNVNSEQKSYISMTGENGIQWHIDKRGLCSIHIIFETNIALFRQRQAFTLMLEWRAEWLTELLSDTVAEAPVSQQLWKRRVKGQTGGETRKHSGSDCWGGEAGWVCADGTEDPAWHDIKKMLSCGFVWIKHRSKCCEGYRRSMRDEGASLESSPLQKPGSSMGRLSCFSSIQLGTFSYI